MNLRHACGAALLDNFCSKVDFVMWWTNTRTELHDQPRRVRSKMFSHLLNCLRSNRKLGSFFPRMNQTNRRRFWIRKVNCATIGYVNAERDLLLVCDQSVTTREFFVGGHGMIDNRDFVAVNLSCGQKRQIRH